MDIFNITTVRKKWSYNDYKLFKLEAEIQRFTGLRISQDRGLFLCTLGHIIFVFQSYDTTLTSVPAELFRPFRGLMQKSAWNEWI